MRWDEVRWVIRTLLQSSVVMVGDDAPLRADCVWRSWIVGAPRCVGEWSSRSGSTGSSSSWSSSTRASSPPSTTASPPGSTSSKARPSSCTHCQQQREHLHPGGHWGDRSLRGKMAITRKKLFVDRMFKCAIFDIKPRIVTKSSSQMSNYTQQKIPWHLWPSLRTAPEVTLKKTSRSWYSEVITDWANAIWTGNEARTPTFSLFWLLVLPFPPLFPLDQGLFVPFKYRVLTAVGWG